MALPFAGIRHWEWVPPQVLVKMNLLGFLVGRDTICAALVEYLEPTTV